jgi:hypothetical protein
MDGLIEITEGISHDLHAVTVVPNREISLDKVVDHGVEVEGMCLAIPKKLLSMAESGR